MLASEALHDRLLLQWSVSELTSSETSLAHLSGAHIRFTNNAGFGIPFIAPFSGPLNGREGLPEPPRWTICHLYFWSIQNAVFGSPSQPFKAPLAKIFFEAFLRSNQSTFLAGLYSQNCCKKEFISAATHFPPVNDAFHEYNLCSKKRKKSLLKPCSYPFNVASCRLVYFSVDCATW